MCGSLSLSSELDLIACFEFLGYLNFPYDFYFLNYLDFSYNLNFFNHFYLLDDLDFFNDFDRNFD